MDAQNPRPFETLSRLLRYPDAEYREDLARCPDLFRDEHPDVARLVGRFAEQVQDLPVEKLQELFTQTFDLNPVCALEVGWQLFGEEYSRGGFLVSMREQLRRRGIEESRELPDHMTHVLPLLDRMDEDEAREFTKTYLAPAVKKMTDAFKDKDSPFKNVLLAVEELLNIHRQAGPAEASHG